MIAVIVSEVVSNSRIGGSSVEAGSGYRDPTVRDVCPIGFDGGRVAWQFWRLSRVLQSPQAALSFESIELQLRYEVLRMPDDHCPQEMHHDMPLQDIYSSSHGTFAKMNQGSPPVTLATKSISSSE